MKTYARLTEAGEFDRLVDLTDEQFALLQANGKAVHLRLWVEDAHPVPTADEVVERGPIAIGPVEAHNTWIVRAKTALELSAESDQAERTQLKQLITNLTASVQNPDVTGTVAERLVKLESRTRRLERIALHQLRTML